jgi:hypothetical protein
MIRTWDRFYELLDRHGTLATVIIPLEWPEFCRRTTHLDVDVRETVTGFNLTKGSTQSVRLALIRSKPLTDPAVARASALDRWWAKHPWELAPELKAAIGRGQAPSDPAVGRTSSEQLDIK